MYSSWYAAPCYIQKLITLCTSTRPDMPPHITYKNQLRYVRVLVLICRPILHTKSTSKNRSHFICYSWALFSTMKGVNINSPATMNIIAECLNHGFSSPSRDCRAKIWDLRNFGRIVKVFREIIFLGRGVFKIRGGEIK